MRLTSLHALSKDFRAWPPGWGPEHFLSEIRVRLVDFRPSALEKRGEPPLAEIGSCVYGVPDWYRFHLGARLAMLRFRRKREMEGLSHTSPADFCRLCALRAVDLNDADALERLLGEEGR